MEDDLQALQGIHLSPVLESRLELLARTAEALGLDEPSIIGINHSIANVSTRRLNLKLSVNRAIYVEKELRLHLAKLEAELALLRKWTVSLSGVTPESETAFETGAGTETAESLERRRQVIIRKAKEYQAQLVQLNSTNASSFSTNVSISELTRLQEQNKEREKEIRRKRKKVEAFRGLPANPDLARLTLLQATQNLQDLTRVREGLLGKMVDG
ncbi:uncharacterized protein C8R40DRAFT_1078981 [Lentinula edodes]|uniref:uncharacterized protein n=1 Tax=Lentinula edodes TaxID=5353 RepID=UPI001E8E9C5C|nr:uncharacterized protein C8R40DRAFT_1078981 [Lentinula edodes]KAH7881609.1 hypothetical protein C8R40DRAFT_1078981 [Lentinula edodes]